MKPQILLVAVLAAALTACAFNEGSKERGFIESITSSNGKSLPKPSPQYQPREVLPFPSQQVYKAAINTLDDSRISIANESKEDGRISTDYIAGPTFSTAFGILGSNSSRYKYLISVKESGRNSTTLRVTAYLESSGSSIQSWRDVSADNQQIVANLQNALMEDIEKRLK